MDNQNTPNTPSGKPGMSRGRKHGIQLSALSAIATIGGSYTIYAAHTKAEFVPNFLIFLVLGPLLFLDGLAYIIWDEKMEELFGIPPTSTRLSWVLGILFAAVAIPIYFFLRDYVRSLGYLL